MEVIRSIPVRIYDDCKFCGNKIEGDCRYIEIWHDSVGCAESEAWCNLFFDEDLDGISLSWDKEAREWKKCDECKKIYEDK